MSSSGGTDHLIHRRSIQTLERDINNCVVLCNCMDGCNSASFLVAIRKDKRHVFEVLVIEKTLNQSTAREEVVFAQGFTGHPSGVSILSSQKLVVCDGAKVGDALHYQPTVCRTISIAITATDSRAAVQYYVQ